MLKYFGGYILPNGNILGLNADYREFEFSNQNYLFEALIYQIKLSNWRLTLGAGRLGSTEVATDGVIVLRLTHILAPSLPLF